MIALSIFLGMIGPWQIAIVVALVLLMFGGKKIPELMKGLGTGIKEFKDATKTEDEEAEVKENTESKK
ncbi:Sec-independent protein translocase subunit TatA/TatB [Tenacibaculum aestuariivivum]|uniref:Sec-independent protein translocase subunit TatA/TatB n=1 Tax=Tenacibaculum aestuariivivum TaxID=2006131 RepID=UPI003AB89465